jgi:uncharacterized protein YndB with AHSA1/START domain
MSRRVVLRRVLPATREEVFEAWTDAEGMRAWMCADPATEARVSLDVRVGGTFTIDMIAPEKTYPHHGEYLEIEPPRRLVFTWFSEATRGLRSVVSVELFERGDETELVLTHDDLPGDEETARSHEQGWGAITARLGTFLARTR